MNTTERALHPSRAQIESLLEFLERNPSLAKGFSKVPSARDAARRSWESIALQLNSMGGCVKTWKQWTKYWADKKSAVKKKSALRYRARNKTGGGAEVVELNNIEEKILMLMGGESFATGDRHLQINPFDTSANTSQGQADPTQSVISLLEVDAPLPQTETSANTSQGQAHPTHNNSISLLGSQLLEVDMPLPQTEISQSADHNVAPSPPRTPPRRISVPASPPLPTTPSGSGRHPTRRTINAQRRLLGTPPQNQTPSLINTPSSPRLRQRRQTAPPTQRLSQFSRMTERFLAIEEQRIEVDRRNSLLFEAIVNHARERDTATSQALLAIGEGLKLLAEALKQNQTSAS